MERVRGRPAAGLYLGAVCLVFVAWLAEPQFIAGLPIVLYPLAAGCCLLRLLSGSNRLRAAALLVVSVLMLSSEASWLARWTDVFAVQLVVGCLMIVPAFQWLRSMPGRARETSFFPPPECALAVLVVTAQSVLLALFMPAETLVSIGRFAEASLGLLFFCWCCSMALAGRMSAAAIAEIQDVSDAAMTQEHREMLREAIRTVRARDARKLRHPAAGRSAKPVNLVNVA